MAKRRLQLDLDCTHCPEHFVREIRRAALAALNAGGDARSAEISVAIVSDDDIAEVNERWLGHAGPTDVITFDLRDDPKSAHLKAQIVISLDTARREARLRGHAWRHEILLYVVHAVLHLLGHDDHRAADRAAMHRLEDRILDDLGIG